MIRRKLTVAGLLFAAAAIAGCAGGGAAASPTAAPSQAASEPAAASQPAASEPAASEAGTPTVEAKPVGDLGDVLVAGSNGMTVYIFTKDVKDSGESACTGDCLATWPALTVAEGAAPTGGTGVTGTLGTITRADDGTLQVTYNGLPLYFFKNDKEPGDSNGVYENWEAVKP
jgi:predicted lipoprotein with Yx(FWY)xxD motif